MRVTNTRRVDKRGNTVGRYINNTVHAARQIRTIYVTATIVAKAAYMISEV